jgi:hypothetical protein
VPKIGLVTLALDNITEVLAPKTAKASAQVGRSLIEDNKSNTANQSGLDTSLANDEDFALDLTPEDVANFLQLKLKQD